MCSWGVTFTSSEEHISVSCFGLCSHNNALGIAIFINFKVNERKKNGKKKIGTDTEVQWKQSQIFHCYFGTGNWIKNPAWMVYQKNEKD